MQSQNLSLTQRWLRQNIQAYLDRDIVYSHVDAVLAAYPTFRPKTDIYTYDDGRSQLMLCVHGLLPITFRGASYNIPIALWLTHDYPREPPLVYVVPTSDMLIKASKYVDISGRCEPPYSHTWRKKSEGCNLSALVEVLADQFSREPPVYARPRAVSPPRSRQDYVPTPPSQSPDPAISNSQSRYANEPLSQPDYATRSPPQPGRVQTTAVSATRQLTQSPPISQASLPSMPPHVQEPPVYRNSPSRSSSATYHLPPPVPPQSLPSQRWSLQLQPPQQYASLSPQQPHGSPPHLAPQPQQYTSPPPQHYATQQCASPRPQQFDPQQFTSPHQYGPPPHQPNIPPHQPNIPPHQPNIPPHQPNIPPHQPNIPPHQPNIPPHQPKIPPPHPTSSHPTPNFLDEEDPSSPPVPIPPPSTAPPRPPNPEILRLHSTVHAKIARSLDHLTNSLASDTARLQVAQADLLAGEPAIRDEMARLEAVKDVCKVVGVKIGDTVRKAEAAVDEIKRKGDPEVDELICGPTIVHNQLIDLVAEDNAIEDTVYHLHRALNAGRIDLDKFLRTTRSLAEEQFMKRALAEKIVTSIPMGAWT